MTLSYRWGHNSRVCDSLEVTARLWSTKRMGRCLAQPGEALPVSGAGVCAGPSSCTTLCALPLHLSDMQI